MYIETEMVRKYHTAMYLKVLITCVVEIAKG